MHFQKWFVTCGDYTSNVYILQILTELFELGEEKQGVTFKTISRLCKWAQTDSNALRQSARYIDRLITAIMFGPVHSRGKRYSIKLPFIMCYL